MNTMVVAQLPDSAGQFSRCYCVTDLLDYDDGAGTVSVAFAGSSFTVPLINVRRVHRNYEEYFKSMSSQQDSIERIKEALLEHRRLKNGADKAATKTPARKPNRYASIDTGPSLAPSPAKPEVAKGPGRDLAKKPVKTAVTPPKAQPALSVRREAVQTEMWNSPATGSRRSPAGETRQAQRLSNATMEIYFPVGAKVTAKLPNGVVDVVDTDKAFGKIYRK